MNWDFIHENWIYIDVQFSLSEVFFFFTIAFHYHSFWQENYKSTEEAKKHQKTESEIFKMVVTTTIFFGIEIANICKTWHQEPWVTQDSRIRVAFLRFLAKAYKVVRWDQGPDPYYIHLKNTFDGEGRQYAFRRIDFVNALHTWMLKITTTNIESLNENYEVIRLALEQLEPLLDPSRENSTPVECHILESEVYMNGHA